MKYILAHPTLIMQLATFTDHTVHTRMVKLGEALMLMLGGIECYALGTSWEQNHD